MQETKKNNSNFYWNSLKTNQSLTGFRYEFTKSCFALKKITFVTAIEKDPNKPTSKSYRERAPKQRCWKDF